jgi:hypothetical protein
MRSTKRTLPKLSKGLELTLHLLSGNLSLWIQILGTGSYVLLSFDEGPCKMKDLNDSGCSWQTQANKTILQSLSQRFAERLLNIHRGKNQVSQISCQISQEQSETLSLQLIFHSPLSKVTLWFTTLKLEDTDGFSHVSTKRTSYWEYLQYLNGQRRCSFVSSTAANPIDNWLNLW